VPKIMAHRTRLVRAAALAASGFFFLSALCGPGCRRDDDPGPAGNTSAQPALRFEPATRAYRDVGVGETLTERIALVSEQPVEWGDVLLVSSCDCLLAEYVGTPTPTRAEVEISVVGLTTESIDGEVRAETPQRVELALFRAPIDIARRAFVEPREVRPDPGSEGRVEFVVGQAFARDAKLPEEFVRELDPGAFDETKLVLSDFDDTERETTDTDVILRARIECTVVDEARPTPFQTEVPIEFGEPPQQRRVKIHWPGNRSGH
jgi:hypothetical protein